MHRSKNQVRIIAGQYRHRLLRFPDCDGLHPTSDRTRETLFNWLGSLRGYCCLDLFAGSGALGFEAASRGADYVLMVERNAQAVKYLNDSKRELEAKNVEIVMGDALLHIKQESRRFDVVFLDPPFGANMLPRLLDTIPHCLTTGGQVYIESDTLPILDQWQITRTGKSCHTQYALLKFIANS
ncbi:MAG: 16S rRNA (guanine(966)-N(2))-methyltransferase RsmD [Neisseriales bacterium]|nr:MAG: 16S rRNA (guanine(966)-N(2))-methyltransferase RsmD [Neisseriales bacterium]